MTSQRRVELEQVIGEVAASYGAGRLIDSLSSAQLPNKRQVIEALNHLKAVMYLGYYSTGSPARCGRRSAASPPPPRLAPLPGVRDPGRADRPRRELRGLPQRGRAARPGLARDRDRRPPAQGARHPRAPLEGRDRRLPG